MRPGSMRRALSLSLDRLHILKEFVLIQYFTSSSKNVCRRPSHSTRRPVRCWTSQRDWGKTLFDAIGRMENDRSPEQVAAEIAAELKAKKKYAPGFGHRIHTDDPRTKGKMGY